MIGDKDVSEIHLALHGAVEWINAMKNYLTAPEGSEEEALEENRLIVLADLILRSPELGVDIVAQLVGIILQTSDPDDVQEHVNDVAEKLRKEAEGDD